MDKIASMGAFIKVAESNSFSLAAHQLGVGSSSVTRSISGLERRLGVKLLERTTRKISLTPAGEVYLECCKNVLGMIESTESDIAGRSLELSGMIQVGVSTLHGSSIFGPLLTRFAKLHPRITLDIVSFDAYSLPTSAELDMVLMVSSGRKTPVDSVSLGTLPMTMVASPEYLAAWPRPMVIDDLSRHRCLNLSPEPKRPVWQFSIGGEMVDCPINPCMYTRNGDSLLAAALEGLGLACLPANLVELHLQSGKLERVLVDHPLAPLDLSMRLSSAKLQSHRTRSLAEFLVQGFSAEY